MPILFKTEPASGFFNDSLGLANFLVPNNDGSNNAGYGIDVVNDFAWTLSKKDPAYENRGEIPRAILTEYRVTLGQLFNATRYYATGIDQLRNPADYLNPGGGDAPFDNPYARFMYGYYGLFDFSKKTNFWYQFPYFSEINGELRSNYVSLDILEKAKGAIASVPVIGPLMADVAEAAATVKFQETYPRVGIADRPKLWESSDPRQITISFPLYNTVSEEDTQKNWELCYLLTYQNMYNKRDFITSVPPVFYTVYIPGQYFSIAAYVSNLIISNKGNIHYMNIGQGAERKRRNIPDVYEVNMTLTDFIMPSQNMHSVLLTEQPVNTQIFDQFADVTSPGTGGS